LHPLIKDFHKIFLDLDRDGFVDSVNLQIHLFSSSCHPEVLCAVMDLSAAIGFETMGMSPPLVTEGQKGSSWGYHLYIGLDHEFETLPPNRGIYFLKESDKTSLAQSIRNLSLSLLSRNGRILGKNAGKGFKKGDNIDLLRLFSIGGLFHPEPQKPWLVHFPYRILLFSSLELRTAIEAANFSSRLGLETVQLSLPFAFPWGSRPKRVPFIYVGKREDLDRIRLRRLRHLDAIAWDGGVFLIPSQEGFSEILISGTEKGLQRILRYLSTIPTNSKEIKDPILRAVKKFIRDLEDSCKGFFSSSSSSEKIIREFLLFDERKEVLKILKERLKESDSQIGSIEILTMVVRPLRERRRLESEIKKLLRGLGGSSTKIRVVVLNAYKPGLSWMREVVLKEILKKGVDRVEITFKPFKEKGLEEEERWLQEIYPIDEILSRRLGISKDRIAFKKDSRIKEVYRVCAWRGKEKVYEGEFSPKWERKDYLPFFPKLGKTHPWIGWINLKIDGKEVMSRKVKTWMEQVWETYQKGLLPLLKRQVDRLCTSSSSLPNPLFEAIRFDLFLNYPAEGLGVDEERISPLEALHEEFYFVTLEFFSRYLKRKGLTKFSAGRILPIIHPNERKTNGKLRFTLIHRPDGFFREKERIKIGLEGVAFRGSDLLVHLFVEGEGGRGIDRLRKRMRDFKHGVFRIERIDYKEKPKKGFRLIAIGSNLIKGRQFLNKKQLSPIKIPTERPIGYKEYLKMIRSFEGRAGVNVVEEGDSSAGFPIYSLEHSFPSLHSLTSQLKGAVFKPTFFINCRHHANEVSSTNAGLRLSSLLVTNLRFLRWLKRVNVVINPMENVDGVNTLEEMLRWTPRDKLHAARYNWAGQEYYLEYFNPRTPFGEARVKPEIWQRWFPDICVDNHGFPSHEWEQPFSGYSPFRFREWWIPKAFFFIYLPFLEEKKGSKRRERSEKLGKWISSFLLDEEGIIKRNQTFAERYWKYRGAWMSRSQKMGEGIFTFPLQKRFQKSNFSYRYPSITSIEFITEVADEVAYGRFLRECVKAHLETNLSVIRLLNSCHFPVKKKGYKRKGGVEFFWHRERGLTFPQK
jgi:hypothetical protein